jgi:hypothetical protein
MVRYMVAAAVGALYLGASYWIVHTEGESFRDSLRKTRESTEQIAKHEGEAPKEPAALPKANGPPRSQPAAEPTAAPLEIASAEHHSEPKPDNVRKPGHHGQLQSKDREKLSHHATNRAMVKTNRDPAPEPAEAAAANPRDPAMAAKIEAFKKANAYWNRDFLKKAWDVDRLASDTAMENDLGRQLHDVIVDLNPTVADERLRRVKATADPLLKTVSRKDIRYTFYVLDSDAVNAFSHPGGYIYVSRGLFNMIGEDESYALEFVLGHEMAHIERRHAIKCLQDPGVKQAPLGTIQKVYGIIIPSAYLDNQEFEADAWVFSRMRSLDRTNRECLAFLNKLDGYASAHGFVDGRAKPMSGYSLIDNHLAAHTAAMDRLKRLKELRDKK